MSVISNEIASLFILVLPDRNAYKEFQDEEKRIEYKGTLSGDEIKFTCRVDEFAAEESAAKRAKQPAPRRKMPTAWAPRSAHRQKGTQQSRTSSDIPN
jgi:hypothetical protein